MRDYSDIIYRDRPISNHKHLDISSRASQFAPFAALTGYSDNIREVSRVTEMKKDIGVDMLDILNRKFNYINMNIDKKVEVEITYFIPDMRKSGGSYTTKKGIIKKLDLSKRRVIFEDMDVIVLDDIYDISSDIFNEFY